MPFSKWAVEPVFLSRKPLPPDKNSCEFHTVTNVQLVNCIRQLSSVAEIADKIFTEIGSECRLVVERAKRLKEKITLVQDVVENLNARAVKVPVSDLSETARLLRHQKPYESKYEKSTQLFLPSTRPPCIDQLYNAACATPVAVICTIDKYRTDGLSSSELFMVTPVLGGERKRRQKTYLDIETRKPANFSLARSKQDSVQSGSSSIQSAVAPSMGFTLKQNENLELERLPSPEEQAMLLSLEYPSTVVPIDTSGRSFNKMSLLRRSLLHADFVIKRKKSKKKSKRRHTFCEGQNRDIEQAIRNVTNSSCQTDDFLDTTVSSSTSINRSLSKRRSRSALDNSRRKTILDEMDLDSLQQESKDSATEDDKEKTPSKASTINIKKSKTISSLRSRSFNPISSLSAAISIAAVKMRNSTRGAGSKHDDGRSSSGNWSASSSTRASVDSDHQHTVSPMDGVSSPSRNSVGKDSVLSDATQIDPHNRSRDEILLIQSLSNSPIKRKRFGAMNLPWEPNHGNGRISSTPTPDFTSQGSSSTPLIRSPYAGRRGISDDGDSSVYSVDTDGYYTSMHTDSGLWCNAVTNIKLEDVVSEIPGFRQRQESQSSVSTIGNSSINSFLSKSATECSSNSGSLKRVGPEPPPRVSSSRVVQKECKVEILNNDQDIEDSDKSYSPHPPNGSTSESEHEVRDRIRVKTTISANRYPSMCAVSPETSEDEISDTKKKKIPNVNVIVAEVHREEKPCDSSGTSDIIDSTNSLKQEIALINQLSSINMYRSETPLPSNFSSSICPNNNPIATSTPRSGINITTFSPDLNEARNNKGTSCSRFRELSSNFDSDEELTVTENPIQTPSGSDKSLIPLKYAQRITVTPIARSDSSSSFTGTIKRTPLKSHNSNPNAANSGQEKTTITKNKKDSQPSYISFQAPDSPVSSVSSFGRLPSNEKISASPTSSLSRSVARVTLDPTGKVVYSSNSLGRINNSSPNKNAAERTYATLPLCQTQTEAKLVMPLKQISSSCKIDSNTSVKINEKENSNIIQDTISKPIAPLITEPSSVLYNQNNPSPQSSTTTKRDFSFRPSRGGRFCRSYFPSHLISPQPSSETTDKLFPKATYTPTSPDNSRCNIYSTNQQLSANPVPNYSVPCSQTPEYRSRYAMHNRSLHYPTNTVPNMVSDTSYSRLNSPTTSNIWPGRLYNSQDKNNCGSIKFKQDVVNKPPNICSDLYAKKNSPQASVMTLRPPDLIPSGESPPSTLDITSPAGSQKKFNPINLTLGQNKDTSPENHQKNLKSMSASELFAIIHSSKKKHNIKTESEISMSPMSSRSVSPALSQSSLSKLQPVETGVLSKRNDSPLHDKTKWCNSMPSNFRKQTVNDKLGSTKPTSMHDFKMLLLQTRTGVNDINPKPSAAELLKVSPTKSSPMPQNNSSSKSPVPSFFKSPTSHYSSNPSYSPGHGTVPIKRSMRTRSPYLTRYDSAYPPIMEDCSEEIESYDNSKCLTSNPSFNQSAVYRMQDTIQRPSPISKATSTWV